MTQCRKLFPLEGPECPVLMCNPQCVPGEQDRDVFMLLISEKFYPSVQKNVCIGTCTCTSCTSWSPPQLFQPITLPYHQEIQRNKTNVLLSLTETCIFLLKNHEVKTDVLVCCRHAKQMNLSPKNGFHIPSFVDDSHCSAKPRYQHSPSIKLSQCSPPKHWHLLPLRTSVLYKTNRNKPFSTALKIREKTRTILGFTPCYSNQQQL